MIFNVPQFIDVEDKIVGPLTWRQLLWMIGMGILLLILFNTVSRPVFFVVSVPIVVVFFALAFYRPYNQPLIVYVGYAIIFLFRPKVSVWERPIRKRVVKPQIEKKEVKKAPQDKRLTLEEIKRLAQIVDHHGRV